MRCLDCTRRHRVCGSRSRDVDPFCDFHWSALSRDHLERPASLRDIQAVKAGGTVLDVDDFGSRNSPGCDHACRGSGDRVVHHVFKRSRCLQIIDLRNSYLDHSG